MHSRVGAGAGLSGVGALVAARRAWWRVGPSPRGRPQGPTPHIRATPAPTRGGVSTPQKPTPESHLRLPSLTGYRPQHLHYALLTVDPHPIAGV